MIYFYYVIIRNVKNFKVFKWRVLKSVKIMQVIVAYI